MSTVRHVKGLKELGQVLRRDMKARERRVQSAIRRTAQKGAAHVRRNVPVAFSELRDSVSATGTKIVADAPHAAAVEVGSRPHWPPLEPLIKWVKLRGMQGLASDRQLSRLPGTTTEQQARAVNAELSRFAVARSRRGRATALDIDAPRKVAFLIARAISRRGTKPHFYMRNSLAAILGILHIEIEAALPDRD